MRFFNQFLNFFKKIICEAENKAQRRSENRYYFIIEGYLYWMLTGGHNVKPKLIQEIGKVEKVGFLVIRYIDIMY